MESTSIGRWIFFTGLLIAVVGLIIMFVGHLPWIGRLPGDIYIKKGRFSFYFPVVTCVVVSLILNILVRFIHRR